MRWGPGPPRSWRNKAQGDVVPAEFGRRPRLAIMARDRSTALSVRSSRLHRREVVADMASGRRGSDGGVRIARSLRSIREAIPTFRTPPRSRIDVVTFASQSAVRSFCQDLRRRRRGRPPEAHGCRDDRAGDNGSGATARHPRHHPAIDVHDRRARGRYRRVLRKQTLTLPELRTFQFCVLSSRFRVPVRGSSSLMVLWVLRCVGARRTQNSKWACDRRT